MCVLSWATADPNNAVVAMIPASTIVVSLMRPPVQVPTKSIRRAALLDRSPAAESRTRYRINPVGEVQIEGTPIGSAQRYEIVRLLAGNRSADSRVGGPGAWGRDGRAIQGIPAGGPRV